MKFTIRDGLWLTLVIVISLAWAADHAFFMACWALSERRVDLGVRVPGNPYPPGDLGPYEHWAQEMENSDRGEFQQAPARPEFTAANKSRQLQPLQSVDVADNPSPFRRIDEVISPSKLAPSRQR